MHAIPLVFPLISYHLCIFQNIYYLSLLLSVKLDISELSEKSPSCNYNLNIDMSVALLDWRNVEPALHEILGKRREIAIRFVICPTKIYTC